MLRYGFSGQFNMILNMVGKMDGSDMDKLLSQFLMPLKMVLLLIFT